MYNHLIYRTTMAALALTMMVLTGCEGYNPLAYPQRSYRAELSNHILSVHEIAPQQQVSGISSSSVMPGQLPPAAVTGTYSFTVPYSISSFKKSTATSRQYLLYTGRPTPDQKPFCTLTVAANLARNCSDNLNFNITGKRTFILNGLAATEWTGYTNAGNPFAELMVSHLGGGDKLDALAIAPNSKVRKIALKILSSIHWTPDTADSSGE